jgi:hypothetical protein
LYDGILIGNSNLDWHFEFTQSNENAEHHFDDDILVLYPETRSKYNSLINKVLNSNTSILLQNPYWNENGKMFWIPMDSIIISDLKAKIDNYWLVTSKRDDT